MITELNKNEAISFVNLVTEFINVDHKINVEEKEVLDKYLLKLNITKDDVKSLNHDTSVKNLEGASERIRNIVYFELLGIALIDGEYENSEIDYLENLAEKFSISRAKKISFANFYFDYENIKNLNNDEKKIKVGELLKN